jgi:AraC-like DNA-binding protein
VSKQCKPLAFHMAYQLIDPASVANERALFARAVNSVIDGFVPASDYVQLASRHESAWRSQRSERALEEAARLLIDCSLNPVTLVCKASPNLQALKQVSAQFFLNDAMGVKLRMNVVDDAVESMRDTQLAVPRGITFHVVPLAWEHLTLSHDAVACLIDVTRQKIGEPHKQACSSGKGLPALWGMAALLSLGHRMGQQDTAVFNLFEALEEAPLLTIHDAGKAVGCSGRTLQRQLQPMGLSLPRIRLASNLLRGIGLMTDGCDLSEAAVTAGFFDYPHFARTFKRSSGLLPTTYQRILGMLDVPRLQEMI